MFLYSKLKISHFIILISLSTHLYICTSVWQFIWNFIVIFRIMFVFKLYEYEKSTLRDLGYIWMISYKGKGMALCLWYNNFRVKLTSKTNKTRGGVAMVGELFLKDFKSDFIYIEVKATTTKGNKSERILCNFKANINMFVIIFSLWYF